MRSRTSDGVFNLIGVLVCCLFHGQMRAFFDQQHEHVYVYVHIYTCRAYVHGYIYIYIYIYI
jgi:hypothetical protein